MAATTGRHFLNAMVRHQTDCKLYIYIPPSIVKTLLVDLVNCSKEDIGHRRSKRNIPSNSALAISQSVDLSDDETDSRKRKRDGKRREGEKKK